jgi:hypothetical protein
MPDSDIQRLVERIEGAGGPDRELDDEIAFAVSAMGEKVPCGHTLNRLTGHKSGIAARRYTASIDAAMTLVPEGWSFEVRSSGTGDPGQASVWNPMRAPGHEEYRVSNFATPALALCACALKARNPRCLT